jgi:hypothetical protein
MTKNEEQAMLIFERKIFRRIYGPKYEDGEWKIRMNGELEELNKVENIVKWIKGQRKIWLGHLEIMEEDRMPKKIFTQELEGTRQRGRSRKGWREEVERDLQVLGVRRWRELVIGKNGKVLFDRPKPTAGYSANGRRRRRINSLKCYSSRKILQDAKMYRNFYSSIFICKSTCFGRHTAHQYMPDNVHHLHVQQPLTYEKPEAAIAVLGS